MTDEFDLVPPGPLREHLRRVLTVLAARSDGSAGSDLARDVLSGSVSLRTALTSSAYREVVDTGVGNYLAWRAERSADEIADAKASAAEYLDRSVDGEVRS
ncbi:MAG TPA: hypothetical protein VGN37_00600 [Actinocatenispora sp.]